MPENNFLLLLLFFFFSSANGYCFEIRFYSSFRVSVCATAWLVAGSAAAAAAAGTRF
jgi:hypothetical protein